MSEYQDFLNLVAEMRAAQRAYFKDRDRTVLEQSKQLERQVDQWIGRYHEPDMFSPQ